jgi:uncharacterized protein
VPRLGDKTFEQAAGFLRIPNGDNPLDASAVHPEAYPVVERILADIKKDVRELIGDSRACKRLNPSATPTSASACRPCRTSSELEKPGRDPRPEFKTATFRDGVEKLKDLQPGMLLEGVVTNVTNFGAFVDIGVHQDGLVHVSALANTFVKDPHERGQGRRRGQGQGAGGRHPAQAHRADHAPGRRVRRPARRGCAAARGRRPGPA